MKPKGQILDTKLQANFKYQFPKFGTWLLKYFRGFVENPADRFGARDVKIAFFILPNFYAVLKKAPF